MNGARSRNKSSRLTITQLSILLSANHQIILLHNGQKNLVCPDKNYKADLTEMGVQGTEIYNRETLKSWIQNTKGFQERLKPGLKHPGWKSRNNSKVNTSALLETLIHMQWESKAGNSYSWINTVHNRPKQRQKNTNIYDLLLFFISH